MNKKLHKIVEKIDCNYSSKAKKTLCIDCIEWVVEQWDKAKSTE